MTDITTFQTAPPTPPTPSTTSSTPAAPPATPTSPPAAAGAPLQLSGTTAPTAARPLTPEDLAAYTAEFVEKGALSAASYAALEGRGFSKALVDTHIQSQVEAAQYRRTQLLSVVGGEQGWNALATWAAQNITPEEAATFTAIVNGNDPTTARYAMEAMAARFKASNPGPLMSGTVNGLLTAAQPFASAQELATAMGDSRYGNDPGYTQQVQARYLATDNADWLPSASYTGPSRV